MKPEEIKEVIRLHGMWLRSEEGGRRAVLRDADLSGADLSGAVLRDADLRDAVLRDANLSGADLSGAVLRDADLSGADLSGAVLRDADLRDAVLRDANLIGANLIDADLRGANLSGANLIDADLRGANLSGASLRGANLSGANLSGANIPTIEKLHTKIRDAINNGENLDMGSWHNECGTSHCRAGWAITLAGEAGKALEAKVGSAAAGALIFAKNYPDQRVPDFYCTNGEALADINRCADEEAALSK